MRSGGCVGVWAVIHRVNGICREQARLFRVLSFPFLFRVLAQTNGEKSCPSLNPDSDNVMDNGQW